MSDRLMKHIKKGFVLKSNQINPTNYTTYEIYTSFFNRIPAYYCDSRDVDYSTEHEKFAHFGFNNGMKFFRRIRKALKDNNLEVRRIFNPVKNTGSPDSLESGMLHSNFIVYDKKRNCRSVVRIEFVSIYYQKRSDNIVVKSSMSIRYGADYRLKAPDYSIIFNFSSSSYWIHNFILKLIKSLYDEFNMPIPRAPQTNKQSIYLLVKNEDGGFVSYPYRLEDEKNLYGERNEFIRLNYGADFVEKDRSIKKSLNDYGKSGLYIFNGPPGTGKSSYIKHLFSTIDRRFFYIPMSLSDGGFDDPSVIKFFLQNPEGVYVIEDAEKLVRKRDKGQNSGIASLLNMSDGILSSLLNIQFIITFNTDIEEVDQALFRSGRLINHHHFDSMKGDDIEYFFSYHQKPKLKYESEMKLCDMYREIGDDVLNQKLKKTDDDNLKSADIVTPLKVFIVND